MAATTSPSEQRRDTVVRARRAVEMASHESAMVAVRRRYVLQTASGPTESSSNEVVLLRKDLLNVVGSPSPGAVEVEVVIDSDGGIRFYALP